MADVELDQLTFWRAEFPEYAGSTRPDQLYNAWKDAEARIKKYTDLRYSETQAQAILYEVETWIKIHRSQFVDSLKDSSRQEVAAEMQLQLGAVKMQQYIVAAYSEAARGLGPWLSGLVGQNISEGQASMLRMEQDYYDRIAVFGMIHNMDNDGALDVIFHPEKSSQFASDVGWSPKTIRILVIAGAVVVGLVGLGITAAVCHYKIESARLQVANKQHEEDCHWAQSMLEKDPKNSFYQNVVKKCFESTADLMKRSETPDPISGAVEKLLIVAAVLGVGYLGLTLLPPLLAARAAKREVLA